MNERLKKINAYILLVVMTFSTMFSNMSYAFATEEKGMEPKSEVTYNEDYSEANISFDVTKVSDKYQVEKLIAKDGQDQSKATVIYDRNDDSLSDTTPQTLVTENGKYPFQVVYTVKSETASTEKATGSQLENSQDNQAVDEKTENADDEEGPTDSEVTAANKDGEATEANTQYAYDFTVEVNEIGKKAIEKEKSISNNVQARSVSNTGLFKVSTSPDAKADPVVSSDGNSLMFGKGVAGAFTSKFTLDFSKSFNLKGTFKRGNTTSNISNGILAGIALHSNPNKVAGNAGGNNAMLNMTLWEFLVGQTTDIGDISKSGMLHGLMWAYTSTGTVETDRPSSLRLPGIYGYKFNNTIYTPLKADSGVLSTTGGYVQGDRYTRQDGDAPFELSFICKDSSNGTGELTINLGGNVSTYNIVAKDIFGEKDDSGMNNGWHEVNFTLSGSVSNNIVNNGDSGVTFKTYEYTGFNPISQDDEEHIKYYKEENGKMVELTPMTTVKKGEKIYGIVKIDNNGGAGVDDSGTSIDSSTAKYPVNEDFSINSLIQRQMSGTGYPAMPEKDVTASITDIQEAYTSKSIDELTDSDFTAIDDGKMTLPAHTDSNSTYLKFAFTSAEAGFATQNHLNLTIGKAPFATKTFSYVSGEYNAVDVPVLSVPAKYVAQNEVVDDAFMRSGVYGRLFDEKDLSELLTDGRDKVLTYTNLLDTSTTGEKKISYTIEDTRTGLTTTVERTFIVTDKYIIDGSTAIIDAQNAYITASQAKALTSESELVNIMKATSQDVEGDSLPVTATAAKFDEIKAGTLGTYTVAFSAEDKDGNKGEIERTLTVISDDAVIVDGFGITAEKIMAIDPQDGITEDDEIKTLLNVIAFHDGEDTLDDVTVGLVNNDKEAFLNGQEGIYEILLKNGKAEYTSYIFNGDSRYDASADHKYVVRAADKTITSTEFKALTNDGLLFAAIDGLSQQYKGVEGSGTPITEDVAYTIEKPTGYDAAQAAGTTGVYKIVVSNNQSGEQLATRTIYLTVTDDTTVISPNGEIMLSAKSVIMTQSQIKALGNSMTDEILRNINSVTAKTKGADGTWNDVDAKVTDVAPGSRAELAKATPGIYKFTYSVGTEGKDDYASKTVSITVMRDGSVTDGKDSVFARNGVVSSTEAKTFTDEKKAEILIEKLGAFAYTVGDDDTVNSVTPQVTISDDDWESIKKGHTGEYEVTFKNGTQEITVKLTVSEVAGDEDVQFAGNHINMSKSEAERILKLEKTVQLQELIAKADAKFIDKYNGANVEIVDFTTDLKAAKGEYEVTFKTAGDYEGTVTIEVSEDVVEKDGTSIKASSFVIGISEVTDDADALKTLLIERADAEAWNTETKENVVINSVTHNIKAQTGLYPVTFEANGAEITVTCQVMDNVNPPTEQNAIGIAANDFTIAKEEVATLDKTRAIELSGAKAWLGTTGEELEITDFDGKNIKAQAGVYEATFTTNTAAGVKSQTVKVTVTDQASETDTIMIFANDFELSVEEAKSIDLAKAVELAGAHAYKKVGHENVPITVFDAEGNLKAEKGTYRVTFETDGDPAAKVTVNATVKDVINRTDSEAISANHFSIAKDDVSSLDLEKAIKLANAKAWKLDDNKTPVEITGFNKDNLKAEVGTYKVTFTTDAGTAATVDVYVQDTVVEGEKDAISANNFSVSVDEVKAGLSDEKIIELANAKAWLISDGSEVEITVEHAIKAEKGTYTVIFTTVNGTKTAVDATVTDNGTEDEQNRERITANNIHIQKDKVASLDLNTAIKLAHATAKNIDTNEAVEITGFNKDNVKAQVGTYDASFSTAKGTKQNIKVIVSDVVVEDEKTGEGISANDFTISIEEAKAITLKDAIEKSGAKAFKLSDGSEVEITDFDHDIKAEKGTYTLTFKTAAGTQATVKVTVSDDVVVDEDTKEAISANDFTVGVNDVASLDLATAVKLANAKAWNTEDYSSVAITGFDKGDLKAERGTYDVTFSTDAGTSKSVKVTVMENSVVDDDIVFSANNIRVSVEEVAGLDLAQAVRLSNAQAYRLDGSKVEITDFDKSAVEEKVGTYDATFTVEGEKYPVKVIVTDAHKVENGEEIFAYDFAITTDEVAGLDLDKAVKLSGVKAYDIQTGNEVEITEFDKGNLKAEKGGYEVSFATAKGTSITVTVTVSDNVNVDQNTGETISANNFFVSKEEVDSLDKATAIERANAKAWNTSDHSAVEITQFDKGDLKAENGTYTATFATAKGTKTEVSITVKDEVVIDSDKGEGIAADGFTISIEDIDTLTLEKAIKLSGASAWKLDKFNTPVEITGFDKSQLKKATGEYPLTFTTDAGTSITVMVNVKDSVVSENGESISANDIYVSVAEVASLDLATVIDKADAKAWITDDPTTSVDITVFNKGNLEAKVGTYDASLATAKGTTAPIKIVVSDTVVEDDKTNEGISANNFAIGVNEFESLDLEKAIELSAAKAWKNVGGTKTEIEITNFDLKDAKPVRGEYEVEFSTEAGTKCTVILTVKDNHVSDSETGEDMSANNIVIQVKDVESLDLAKAIELANAQAWKTEDHSAVEITGFDDSNIKASVGTYDASFSTDAGTIIGIKVIVQNNVTEDEDKGEAISANNFSISKSDVESLDLEKAIKLANAKAWKLDDNKTPVEITGFNKDNLKAEVGTYKVTFTTDAGTAATVDVYVQDTVVEGEKDAISANNFSVSVDEVKAGLSDEKIIELANAKAWLISDGSEVEITVEHAIKAEKGTYTVIFTTVNGTKTAVDATVTDNGTEDEQNRERITANNIHIQKDKVASLDLNTAIKLAHATAKNIDTNEAVEITGFNKDNVKAQVGTYDASFSTAKGTKQNIKVIVSDVVVEDEKTGEGISANDFTISIEEAKAITLKDAIEKSGAKAFKLSDGSEVEITDFDHDIKAEKGTYTLTFKTAAGTQATVKVTVSDDVVVDEDTKEAISANDFTVGVNDVASLDLATAVKLANAKAWNTEDYSSVAITGFDKGDLKAERGTYDVTFSTDAGTSKSVKVTVMENSVVDDDIVFSANNIRVSVEEVAGLDLAQAVRLSNAQAYRLDGSKVEITDFDKSAVEEKVGTYDATFTVEGEKYPVKVIVTDAHKVENGEEISGYNFSIAAADVENLTLEKAVQLAGVHAYDIHNGNEVAIVDFDKTNLKAEKGVYDVTFSTAKGTSVTVKATVTDNVTIDENTGEGISANNFSIGKAYIASRSDVLDLDLAVKLANAKAWKLDTMESVPITGFDDSNIDAKLGTYEATFTTDAGTAQKVFVTVTDNGMVNEDTKESITANNFSLQVGEVNDLTLDKVIELSGAYAWNIETGAKVPVTSWNKYDLKDEVGDYEISVSTDAGTDAFVTVSVRDSAVTDENNGEHISANNIIIAKDQVTSLNLAKAIEMSNAVAYEIESHTPVAITVFDNANIKAEVGTYDASLSTAKGTTANIKVIVKDSVTVDDVNKEGIGANNFSIPKDAVEGITNKQLIKLANAKAWNTENGAAIAITDVEHQLKAEKGTYEVTFKTANGTSVTVTAIVTDGGIITPPEGSDELYSVNNIYISKDEVADLDLELAKERSNVKVWKVDDNSAVDVKSFDGSKVEAEKGTYDANFKTDNTTIPVQVIVKDGVTVNDDNKEGIGANDVSIPKSAIEGITDEMLIELAGAEAWNIEDGSKVAIVKVEHQLKPERGKYEVTFSTAKGTSQTIIVTVTDNGSITDKDERFTANDIYISVDEVAGLDLETAIELSGAKAWNPSDNSSEVKIVGFDKSKVKEAVGTYEATFTTETGNAYAVNVHVSSGEVVENGVQIGARDFFMSIEEVNNMTDEMLISKAGAHAFRVDGGEKVAITNVIQSIKAEKGAYEVTFVAEGGASITVTATVKDNAIAGNNGEVIYANNFTAEGDEVEFLKNGSKEAIAELIKRAEAVAINETTGNAVEITGVNTDALKAVKGEYSVVFATENSEGSVICKVISDLSSEVGNTGGSGDTSDDNSMIKTGDSSSIMMLIIVMMIAATGIVVCIMSNKKRSRG